MISNQFENDEHNLISVDLTSLSNLFLCVQLLHEFINDVNMRIKIMIDK